MSHKKLGMLEKIKNRLAWNYVRSLGGLKFSKTSFIFIGLIPRWSRCVSIDELAQLKKKQFITTLKEMGEHKKLCGLSLSFTGNFRIHLTACPARKRGCLPFTGWYWAVEEKGVWNLQEWIKELNESEPSMMYRENDLILKIWLKPRSLKGEQKLPVY